MLRRLLATLTASALLLVALGVPAAHASPAWISPGGEGAYLALGDSVPFGFNPLVPIGSDPRRYVGYPEVAAPRLELHLTNLACPGQTSAGFLSLSGDDNGCLPFRAAAPLHTPYTTSQIDAALAFLRTHRRTRLVTISLGANNLLLCRTTTPDGCTSPVELTAVLQRVSADLTTALTAIRSVYHGPLVALTYYTPYTDPVSVVSVGALDAVLGQRTRAAGGTVADGFTAFAAASARFGGSPCAAGLLLALPTGGCDIHPSAKGAQLLALILQQAVHPAAAPRQHAGV